MRPSFLIFCCVFFATTTHAACNPDISASTPDSQLIDNGDGTITDSRTGLVWKQCLEGLSGDCSGTPDKFTWQQAQQQPGIVNSGAGFAGYTDWRMPNIKELQSIVEEQCYSPAINSNRFPNTPSSHVWSGSPYAYGSDFAWYVYFSSGHSGANVRYNNYAVRLVRSGQ
jgi:hypothetical protein